MEQFSSWPCTMHCVTCSHTTVWVWIVIVSGVSVCVCVSVSVWCMCENVCMYCECVCPVEWVNITDYVCERMSEEGYHEWDSCVQFGLSCRMNLENEPERVRGSEVWRMIWSEWMQASSWGLDVVPIVEDMWVKDESVVGDTVSQWSWAVTHRVRAVTHSLTHLHCSLAHSLQ